MTKRAVIILVLIALISSACGTSGLREQALSTAGLPPSGTLVVALSADPGQLNPAVTTRGAVHAASELLYNGLLSFDPNGQPIPELAASWQVDPTSAIYAFTLRDGVSWHDGVPFTSADVKYSFEEVLLPYHARTKASVGPALASIETPDDHTVVFRFNRSYMAFLYQLDVTEAPIVAKHLYEGSDPRSNPVNARPVGTGPFKFVSYTRDTEIVLEKNPQYFKAGLPVLERVVMRVLAEPNERVRAAREGEVNWVWDVPADAVASLRQSAGLEVVPTSWGPGGSNCMVTLGLNLDRAALKNPAVRLAVSRSLDRQAFVDRALHGNGKVAVAPISTGIAWLSSSAVSLPAFDRAAAEDLLASAGWVRQGSGSGTRVAQGIADIADGTPLAFDLDTSQKLLPYAVLVKESLGAVGFEVNLISGEESVVNATVFNQRNFDGSVISYCHGRDPNIGVRRMYHSTMVLPEPFTNAAGYRNASVDALFDQALGEPDPNQRAGLYISAETQLVADAPYVWLVELTDTRVHSSSCSGFSVVGGLFAESASCAT